LSRSIEQYDRFERSDFSEELKDQIDNDSIFKNSIEIITKNNLKRDVKNDFSSDVFILNL